MDKAVCVHYIIERLKSIVESDFPQTIVESDFPQSGARELLREMYHNLGVNAHNDYMEQE
jgi:hypothetical protein